jgi:hypothetical protein
MLALSSALCSMVSDAVLDLRWIVGRLEYLRATFPSLCIGYRTIGAHDLPFCLSSNFHRLTMRYPQVKL